jgi:hypothetical protein
MRCSKPVCPLALLAALACSIMAPAHVNAVVTPRRPEPALRPSEPPDEPEAATGTAKARLAALPLRFEENLGQYGADVRFVARSSAGAVLLTQHEAVIAIAGRNDEAAVRMRFEGANPGAEPTAEGELGGRANFYVGSDPNAWRTGVRSFGRVRYREIYPGIDLVFYGNDGRLEYDFVVRPGADPNVITLSYDGVRSAEVGARGDLALATGAGEVRLSRPSSYQLRGARQPVSGRYRLANGNEVGFEVGAYDETQPLVIDPTLLYSTYWGSAGGDAAYDVAVDSAGAAYVVGRTATEPGAFLMKLAPSGNQVLFTTYFGGSAVDTPYSVALAPSGEIYVAGSTFSRDFPIVNPLYSSHNGGTDAFVLRTDTAGSLVYSTFVGGSGNDGEGASIAVDSSGAAYVVGQTNSAGFPTANAYDSSYNGFLDTFLLKLTPPGDALVFSTYLGGARFDYGEDLALGATGSIVVCGGTTSTDFPTINAYDSTHAGSRDAFVTVFAQDGQSLLNSTYIGGP